MTARASFFACRASLLCSLLLLRSGWAFLPLLGVHQGHRWAGCSTSPIRASATTDGVQAPSPSLQRTGWTQSVLNWALESPLWKHVLVPQARNTMVKTAEANGIPWQDAKQWLEGETVELRKSSNFDDGNGVYAPDYYRQPFHAYHPHGNLCWDAALEVEIASCAVGARNFPQFGSEGEEAFRGAFDRALAGQEAGAFVPDQAKILDMGCGTGMSTRRLASNFPQASLIQGVDLSPYFCAIGKRLLELEPKKFTEEGGTWVSNISDDQRIDYAVADAANTGLQDASFDVVNLQFVLHELPSDIAFRVVDEAWRLLKPNTGQLWVCEMDFEAPPYAEQRANALLFSLIRSTEPYLDDYAESIPSLFQHIASRFASVTIVPATGRHYALVATKGGGENSSDKPTTPGHVCDLRFQEDGTYRIKDTHLQLWESSKQS